MNYSPLWKSTNNLAGLLLPQDEVHVWKIQRMDGISAFLTNEEMHKAGSFKNEEARHGYMLARAALRRLAATYLKRIPTELILECGELGKPFLKDSDIHFNTSHSGNLIVMAFCRSSEMGIDIECGSNLKNPLALAERYFASEEVKYLKTTDNEASLRQAFLRYWVCKEAALKSSGHGLAGGLENTPVDLKESLSSTIYRGIDRKSLPALEFIPEMGFQGCLVIEAPFPEEKIKWFVL